MGMQDFAGRASGLEQLIAQTPVGQQGVMETPLEDTASRVPSSGTGDASKTTGIADAAQTSQANAPDPEKTALFQRLQAQEQEIGQIRQAMSLQAQQAAKLEEQNFLQSIQDEPSDVRAQKLLEYRERQYHAIIGNLQNQLQTQRHQTEQQRQEQAKYMVANIMAQQFGVPQEDFDLLLLARDGHEMERTAQRLAARSQASQQNETIQQQNAAFLPTGDAGQVVPPEGPKKRSGDLDGLIGSRSYELRAVR